MSGPSPDPLSACAVLATDPPTPHTLWILLQVGPVFWVLGKVLRTFASEGLMTQGNRHKCVT